MYKFYQQYITILIKINLKRDYEFFFVEKKIKSVDNNLSPQLTRQNTNNIVLIYILYVPFTKCYL